jgi:membrane-associated phospholipid phosphatase
MNRRTRVRLDTRTSARLANPPTAAAALLVAGLCVLALALTWVVAALVPATHAKDAVALYDFTLLGRPKVDDLANALLHLLEPALYILWGVLLMAVALRRRRPLTALAVGVVMGMAPLTAETLKPLLAHSHARIYGDEITAASWPSGHASAATALVMCAVLVAPQRLRPTVAVLGALFAVAVGFSLVLLAWHLPSDVLGGYLVGTLWAALAVAGLRAADARSRSRRLRRGVRAVGAGVP